MKYLILAIFLLLTIASIGLGVYGAYTSQIPLINLSHEATSTFAWLSVFAFVYVMFTTKPNE